MNLVQVFVKGERATNSYTCPCLLCYHKKKLLKNKHVTTYQPNFEIFHLRTKPEMLQR